MPLPRWKSSTPQPNRWEPKHGEPSISQVDFDPLLEGLNLAHKQVPFALAKTLTKTAQDAQAVVQRVEKSGGIFRTRNDWTTRNTKIKPATKASLAAEVYTDTGNEKAPDYLAPQQDGAEKVPHNGHRYIAIPTTYLRRYVSANRVIPDNLRPSALLPAGAQLGKEYSGTFAGGRANGEKRVITKGSLKKLGNGDFVAFLQTAKSGTVCIFVRHGGLGYKAARGAEPWYTLVKEASIKPRFPMDKIVEQVVLMNAEGTFKKVITEIELRPCTAVLRCRAALKSSDRGDGVNHGSSRGRCMDFLACAAPLCLYAVFAAVFREATDEEREFNQYSL